MVGVIGLVGFLCVVLVLFCLVGSIDCFGFEGVVHVFGFSFLFLISLLGLLFGFVGLIGLLVGLVGLLVGWFGLV
jgi:hypothetical protein